MPQLIARIGLMMVVAGAVAAAGEVLGREGDPLALRDGFESPRPVWRQEESDAAVNLLDHDRSDLAAHEGKLSERLHFQAGPGSSLFYSYALPKIPVVENLDASLFIRSDRPGIQLFGRVVLPADTDPDTMQPSFVMVAGTVYETADRWQRLSLPAILDEAERRARVIRARTKRPVSLEGAYLDRLVLNMYGGPGETVVFVDDLSISPVPAEGQENPAESIAKPGTKPAGPDRTGAPAADTPGAGLAPVGPSPLAELPEPPPPPDTHATRHLNFVRNRLFKDGQGWVFTGIYAPGANTQALLRFGFDMLLVDMQHDPKGAAEAAKAGFYLMPTIDTSGDTEPAELAAAAGAYPARESVAVWNLGENLGGSTNPTARDYERDRVRAVIAALRKSGPEFSHLTTGGVSGLFPEFARVPQNLDMMGVHPLGWGTMQEIRDYYQYLAQRRDLTVRNPQAFFWTMVSATPPEEVHQAVWGNDVPPAWGVARVQSEQVRLYAYAALSAGYRGLAFKADAELTRGSGRMLLIELAFLNAEIDLFENIIAEGFDPIPLWPAYPPDPEIIMVYTAPGTPGGTNQPGMGMLTAKAAAKTRPEVKPHPSISAAAIATKDNKGKLLLVSDFAANAQWQPQQMAFNKLMLRVPGAQQNAQGYEVTLGGVQVLKRNRVPGGLEFMLPDFGTTTLVLVTTDRELVERIEAKVARIRSLAVAMAIEQASLKLQWTSDINGRLAADGHKVVNAADLLLAAQKKIDDAQEALELEDYWAAWTDARRSSRALRVLMYSHFAQALGDLAAAAMPLAERNEPKPPPQPVFTRKKAPKFEGMKKIPRLLSPISCPPLVSWSTLPQLYKWTSWIRDAKFGDNLLPSGSFEDGDSLSENGWSTDSYPIDGVSGVISSVEGGALAKSKRSIKFAVTPAAGRSIDSLPPYLDHMAVALRTPPVNVGAHQLLRISVKVKMPRLIPAGGGGLIVRDSLGGEALQFRSTNPIPDWSEVILYRRAPADGTITVTLGLAGLAEAQFDDLSIQPIVSVPSLDESEPGAPAPKPPRPPAVREPARTALPPRPGVRR